ncbi:hypothetical protein P3T23_008132 [Paraburkholderia sp. GAS448]
MIKSLLRSKDVRSEIDASAPAVHELDFEFGFQPLHDLRDGRLRQPGLLCNPMQIARLCQYRESNAGIRAFDAPISAQNRRAMVAVMLAVALATLDTAIANTALPSIGADLRSTPAASVWIVNAYQLAMVATILPFAALGDVLGHRRICIGGLVVFTVASLACSVASTLPSLVTARILQGLGGSAMMSVSIALVRALYPPCFFPCHAQRQTAYPFMSISRSMRCVADKAT